MNRTQDLVWQLIINRFTGDELLLEALLRRGFLAYRDNDGVWLGTGSHEADISVLQLIQNIDISRIEGHSNRFCKIALHDIAPELIATTAKQIVALGEHHVGSGLGGFCRLGFGDYKSKKSQWNRYKKMQWGWKLAVCPAAHPNQLKVNEALDIGIALLVKSFPLAGVGTCLSCDGHGIRSAKIGFVFRWDHWWARTVFECLPNQPVKSEWIWTSGLEIRPLNGFGDEAVMLMLEDIQGWARQLLDCNLVDQLRKARMETIVTTNLYFDGPPEDIFTREAKIRLQNILSESAIF